MTYFLSYTIWIKVGRFYDEDLRNIFMNELNVLINSVLII